MMLLQCVYVVRLEYLFDTQLNVFDSDEDVGGDLLEDGNDGGKELVEVS
jgi:hypothetical protein